MGFYFYVLNIIPEKGFQEKGDFGWELKARDNYTFASEGDLCYNFMIEFAVNGFVPACKNKYKK